ncbi:beta-conglycinin beta subunit 1-like [Neltuma alba]|uniref:beta-conglycinin beta subunit 1-like n=1 Tax=Neltuma alba TaxID=207710 RepID=UPI0010A58CBC|nr:beta-conglycinin beta subunit 1-like [Prosopis alba]
MGCFKARLPVLLLLGSVFLAVASVGLAHWEDDENSEYRVCVKNCVFQSDASRSFDCPARCRPKRERQGEKEEAAERDPRLPDPRHPWRPGQTEEGEGEETEGQKPQWQREREQQQGPHQQPRPLRPEEGEEGQQQRPHRQPRPWRPEEGEEGQQERPQRQPRPGGRKKEKKDNKNVHTDNLVQEGRKKEKKDKKNVHTDNLVPGGQKKEKKDNKNVHNDNLVRGGQRKEKKDNKNVQNDNLVLGGQQGSRHDRPGRPGKWWEPEEGQGEEQKQQRENPYYLPSNRFETRFSNEHGQIRVLQKFDQLSPDLRMLRYYRIVEFRSRPSTLVVPHHSDAEYLIINTKGRAIVTLVLPNYKESFNLEQFDVLRVPAGAICYTINRASSQDLEFIKLALPVNIPGQFENFYPSGNQIPNSYLKAFNRKTLQAAFNAPYEEIEQAFWGTEQQQQQQQGQQGSEEGVIVRLPREQLRSLISRAQSRQRREEKSSPLGPFNLKNIQPRYSNNHGTFREAHPQRFEALQDLGIGVSHLRLNEGSMFLPHYNTRAIILAFVAEGQGHTEMACPHLASPEEQEGECGCRARRQREGEQEHREGQFRRVAAQLSKGDFYVVPAGHPVAVRASKNSNLEVVEFVLNAPYNFRNFLAGKSQNVLNELDREVKEAAFEGSGEQVERLLNRQTESFFVDREEQPSRGGRSPRQTNKVAWSSILTAFM